MFLDSISEASISFSTIGEKCFLPFPPLSFIYVNGFIGHSHRRKQSRDREDDQRSPESAFRQAEMDMTKLGLENPLLTTMLHMLDVPDEMEKTFSAPTRTYVRDAKAMASTPADIKELPGAYVFIVDMPGIKPGEIRVQVEDDRILVVSGERKRGPDEEDGKDGGAKYLRMERRVGKFMRKFALPDNANVDAVSAVCQDGVLTVTVQKVPPPEPKKPKTIEVKVA
ncbi:hypothetical protein Cni_G16913 [Canna indica]|uniref:SHSP domain-containing protein n=1 Tax=Canna indica TaxID=4628 RepID=A0AAQ3QG36_9LILI|nr:hypothetical protein Cni_G16913 [Canna indica]